VDESGLIKIMFDFFCTRLFEENGLEWDSTNGEF
jgi:hypothetical protein